MSNLILIGFKACGKTSVGERLARESGLAFIDTDRALEANYAEKTGQVLPCREIYTALGKIAFRALEKNVIADLAEVKNTVIATGGGVILQPENRERITQLGEVVYLSAAYETLLERIKVGPLPTFMTGDVDTEFAAIYAELEALYRMTADRIVDTEKRSVAEIVHMMRDFVE